ncbi:MAG: DUF2070 family protein [archaeon]
MSSQSQVKILDLTKYLKGLPNEKKTISYMLITGIVFFAAIISIQNSFLSAGLTTLIYIWMPTIFSALFMVPISKLLRTPINRNQAFYLSFVCMALTATLLLSGLYIQKFVGLNSINFFIFGLSITFIFQVLVFWLIFSYRITKSCLMASIYPIFCLISIELGSFLTIFQTFPPEIVFAKFLISLSIFLIGICIFLILLDAPAKANFGVSAWRLGQSLLSEILSGKSDVEKKLLKLAEKTDVLVGLLNFKTKKKNEILLVTPYIHLGPFGSLGGAKFSEFLIKTIEQNPNKKVIITHGTATHDLNPIGEKTIEKIISEIKKESEKMEYYETASMPVFLKMNDCQFLAQKFGDTIFSISSFAPKPTEDIDFAIGLAMIAHLGKAIHSDAHNSCRPGHHTIFSGDLRQYELIDGAKKLSTLIGDAKYKLKVGFSKDDFKGYSERHGIGKGGLRILVTEVNKIRTAYIVLDGNNLIPGLREKIIKEAKKYVEYAEVMTSDSHAVNTGDIGYNPIGLKIPEKEIINRVINTLKEAIKNLDDSEIGTKIIKIKGIPVFGPHKASELVSTINSTVAFLKITTPILTCLTMALALLSIFALG